MKIARSLTFIIAVLSANVATNASDTIVNNTKQRHPAQDLFMIEHDGKTTTFAELSKQVGVGAETLRQRYKNGAGCGFS